MKLGNIFPSTLGAFAIAALICLNSLPAAAAAEGSFQRTLQVTGPVTMDLTTGSGDVDVHTGGAGQVQVTGHIRATEKWFDGDSNDVRDKIKRLEGNPPIQQSGNTIRIGHVDDPELRHNISISYEVVVPAETELRTESGSGNQKVEGIRGPLEISAGSGDVKLSGIGDRVHAETGSGDIDINRVNGNVHAKTGSGSIQANEIAGGFEADTGSGHISLQQTAPGSVRVDTGSGGMDLRGVRGSLDAKAGSGTIEAEGSPTGELVLRIFGYLPNVLAAIFVLGAGNIIARFLARSVLIGAVNMNLQYARLLSAGVKWLVVVLTIAMALEHLGIGGGIIRLAFGILFGGIVLALALAVGLGSKELVSRSLDREASKAASQSMREPVGHM